MKKLLIAAAAVTLLLGPAAAHAQETRGGLGFRTLSDPSGDFAQLVGPFAPFIGVSTSPAIGIRQWFSPRVGVDLGVGLTTISVESGPPTTTTDEGTGFAFDVGVPFSVKSWDKVNFILRPGFTYGRTTVKDKTAPLPPNEDTFTSYAVTGELEVEVMIVENVSISAAHGIAYRSFKLTDNDTPENEDKISGFNTSGGNFTQLGFHVYLW